MGGPHDEWPAHITLGLVPAAHVRPVVISIIHEENRIHMVVRRVAFQDAPLHTIKAGPLGEGGGELVGLFCGEN